MQNKALFVTMLAGALTLASCVKNIESQSVTDVRNARAQEILSQAALNNANAAAATTLANAEATLKNAEAELAKANAKIAEANAKKIEAEAELVKVEAQLRAVMVEQEKIELKKKEAELRKLIAEAEAAEAEAEFVKKQIAAQLEVLAGELEIAKSENALALLKAQQELEKYIKAQDEAEREALQEITDKYIAVVDELINLQAQLSNNQTRIATLEAVIESPEEVFAERIAEKKAEIARIDKKIAAIQKYAKVSPEEIEAYLDEARIALMDAENVYQAALKEENEKLIAFNAAETVQTEYMNDWYTKFQSFVYNHKPVWGKYNEEKGVYEQGFLDENNEFVPLWNYEDFHQEWLAYPEPQEGIMPSSSITVENRTYIPAKVNSANFEVLFNELIDGKAKEVADYKQSREEQLKNDKEYYEREIQRYEKWIASYQEYVDAVEPKMTAAEAEVEAKNEARESARKTYQDAYRAVSNYIDGQYNLSQGDVNIAQTNYNSAQMAKDAADNAVISAENELDHAKADVQIFTDNKYYADLSVATLTNDVNVTQKAKLEIEENEKKLAEQKEIVAKAETAHKEAVSAHRVAIIKLAADPTNEKLKAEEAAAATKESEALAKWNEELGKIPALETARNDAQAAFDAVNNPYQLALQNLENAKEAAKTCEENLTAAKARVTNAESALEEVKAAAAAATKAEVDAKAVYDKAIAELAVADEGLQTLQQAANEAWSVYLSAIDEENAAWTELQNLKNSYDKYESYVYQLNAENDGSLAWTLNEYKNSLANAEDWAATDIANKEQELTDLQKEIDEMKANLEKLDGVEAAYVKAVEAKAEAFKAYQEATKVSFDALQARDEAMAEVDGMASTFYFWDEDGNLLEMSVVEALDYLADKKAELEDEIDEYINEIPVQAAAYVEALTIECAEIELRIEVLTKIATEYEEILKEALGYSESPAA